MGANLSVCTKSNKNYSSKEFYTKSDEENLLKKFDEISNTPEFLDLEKETGSFQFIYNYYIEINQGKVNKIRLDLEDNEFTDSHHVLSPLIGQDEDGTWVYIGECLTGTIIKDGRGSFVHLDKKYKFQGYYRNGNANGRGRYISSDKLQEGDWLKNSLIGEGKEITKDKSIYIGKFQDGLYENLGKITFSDKSGYSGEFLKGERHGYGEYNWADGSRFIGNWKYGKFHGTGKYIDCHGNIFEGSWKENQMDGQGEYVWRDGRKYKGNYYNGKKHGYGEMYWPDGNAWRGTWKNGKQHGKGEFVNKSVKKCGNWYEGKFISWQ